MKFNSIREYFYKVQARLYLYVLLPLILFVYLYMKMRDGNVTPPVESMGPVLVPIVSAITLFDWIVALVVFRRRIKPLPSKIMLSEKLEGYAAATYWRFAIIAAISAFLAVCYYAVGSSVFAALFGLDIMLMSVFWPLPTKVCRDLKLKGEERKMVLRRDDGMSQN